MGSWPEANLGEGSARPVTPYPHVKGPDRRESAAGHGAKRSEFSSPKINLPP